MTDFFDEYLKELKKEFKTQAKIDARDKGPQAYNPASIANARRLRKTIKKRRAKAPSTTPSKTTTSSTSSPKTRKRTAKPVSKNSRGYQYVKDPSTGRMRTRAQVEWEKFHPNKKVLEHQCVLFSNGNKNDFSKENLVLGFKAGTPLDFLTCRTCGARGGWDINPPSEHK